MSKGDTPMFLRCSRNRDALPKQDMLSPDEIRLERAFTILY
jgi:hypothetical protein